MTTLAAAQRRRLSLAVHEAGHAVIGVIHGAHVQEVSLSPDGSSGHTQFTAASFGTAGPITHRTHIACAGAVAEAMLAHGPRPTLRQIEARLHGGDRDELHQEAMASLRPVMIPAGDVTALLSRCWAAVADIAADLYLGHSIGHTDVCKALGVTDGGGPSSVQLAMIRG